MLLAVRISSYGCSWEVWRALKKLELLSAAPRGTLSYLSCSPNFLACENIRFSSLFADGDVSRFVSKRPHRLLTFRVYP